MTDKTFGTKKNDINYRECFGAYLVAIEAGTLHVICKDGKIRLPGGTSCGGDSHESVILRACVDATGYDVSVDDYIADADWFNDEKQYHSIRTYYSGRFLEEIAPHNDPAIRHERLPLQDLDRLTFPIERWAVEQGLAMLRADAHGCDDEGL